MLWARAGHGETVVSLFRFRCLRHNPRVISQSPSPTVHEIRARFPAISEEFAFLENAGGTQVPVDVIDAIVKYMRELYVQTGASYPQSVHATESLTRAREFAAELVGGGSRGKTSFGHSTSTLIRFLADSYGETLEPGDEVIIAEGGHEANLNPWKKLASRGVRVRMWPIGADLETCPMSTLEPLLNKRTRIVALPHVSNLLGEIVDVKRVADLVRSAGARSVVDGVAFAPHRAMNVADWGVDWYVFSAYKVFGPHVGVLWGSDEAWEDVVGPNHFFIDKGSPTKFELGCQAHELLAGLMGLVGYFHFLAGTTPSRRAMIERAYGLIESLETPLQEVLLEYLESKGGMRVIGPGRGGLPRVATVSFVHERMSSQVISDEVCRRGIGIRHGHMYSYHLCEALRLPIDDGVVRVSLVHYNTAEEVGRLIDVLDQVLGA